jgi:nitrogen-specific signal transduction histidine kinase
MNAHRLAGMVRGAFRAADREALAEIVLDAASRLLGGDETLLLVTEKGEEPRLAGSTGIMDEAARKYRLELCSRALRLLEESKDTALELTPGSDVRFKDLTGAAGVAAALCVPLAGNGKLAGILCATRLTPGARFGEAELRKAKDFGPVASLAVKNSMLNEQLQSTRMQLAQTQKMEAVGMMVSQVTHDFNNLLTVIINSAQLQIENPANEAGLNLSKEILRMAREAATFIQQLLLFTHTEAPSAEPIDLNAATAEITFIIENLPGRDIKTVYVPAPDLPKVRIKPEHYKQVALNLAVNARGAMPEGGQMTIRTLKAAADTETPGGRPVEYVVLEVSDTGPGIDQENLKKIFEPFFTTKPAGKGTGLGLHIVQTIVSQYNGKITVESPPGGGALFRVYFPAA